MFVLFIHYNKASSYCQRLNTPPSCSLTKAQLVPNKKLGSILVSLSLTGKINPANRIAAVGLNSSSLRSSFHKSFIW